MLSEYWGALSTGQRGVFLVGIVLIAAAAVGLGAWALHDPYVPIASGLSPEASNALLRDLERAKVSYRVAENADRISIPESQLGKAHAAIGGGDVPASVGLELFKDTDFSATDFAQRINYQRALQGELTRTIQTIDGVRNVRVHVTLPDSGLLKRNGAKATAAVSLALQPGKVLTQSQVRGIQRLVAASVPEIKLDDVVVLDDTGASLTRAGADAEGEISAAQLDLKRQADQYLEGKLLRLLQDLVPQGNAVLSVDTVLDERQLRVTTEEPLGARGAKESERIAGVLVKDRQSQRGRSAGLMHAGVEDADGADGADGSDSEHEYAVGHRMEQTLSTPGSIKRITVAVALQGAPTELSAEVVEQLVVNAVGIDRSRGDAVAVMLLPAPVLSATTPRRTESVQATQERGTRPAPAHPVSSLRPSQPRVGFVAAGGVFLLAVAAVFGVTFLRRESGPGQRAGRTSDVDIEATAAKVRQWLNETPPPMNAGAHSGRG